MRTIKPAMWKWAAGAGARIFWGVLAVAAVAGLGGCADKARTLVVTVGGMGFSQMTDLREAVEKQCPGVKVLSAGSWDAYKTDIVKIAKEHPRDHIILIGHSFGCEAIDTAAGQLPQVDLAVFIDPAWNDFSLSKRIGGYLWFKRSDLGIEREAKIAGASGAETIQGGHNDIPHSPQLIAEVVSAVQRVSGEPEMKGAQASAAAGR